MNSPAIDIKDMLVAESSLGLIYATNLFVQKEPISPIEVVTIYDTFGYSPQLTLDKAQYEYPAVQIRVRSKHQDVGYQLAYAIMTALHGRSHETWNETLYTLIRCSSGPALLDWDENGRVHFIINFLVQRRS